MALHFWEVCIKNNFPPYFLGFSQCRGTTKLVRSTVFPAGAQRSLNFPLSPSWFSRIPCSLLALQAISATSAAAGRSMRWWEHTVPHGADHITLKSKPLPPAQDLTSFPQHMICRKTFYSSMPCKTWGLGIYNASYLSAVLHTSTGDF